MLELAYQLVANAGVSEEQPQGGAGLLFGLLKDKLSTEDFAQVTDGFSELGLDADMIGRFVPIVLSFVESKGGEGLSQIVSKVLQGG
jgi:hypothetical protein